MTKKILTVILVFGFLFSFAQKTGSIIRLDGSKISAEELNRTIGSLVDNSQIAGLSIVIIENDRIIYRRVFGHRNRESWLALQDTTAMYAASSRSLSLRMFF